MVLVTVSSGRSGEDVRYAAQSGTDRLLLDLLRGRNTIVCRCAEHLNVFGECTI